MIINDKIDSVTQLMTSSETLAYLPLEIATGEKQPATIEERYGKLLYGIYVNKEKSLTAEEIDLIKTRTRKDVYDTFQNDVSMTDSDKDAMAAAQSATIIGAKL